jgi:ribosome maturation factor RimP
MSKVDPKLHEQLGSLIASMGYALFGCELLPQGRQMVLRIYIDSEKGVTIDDCSRVSHQVSAMMDVLDVIHGRYFLEVSSPGINRPLFELAHYRKYIGSTVKIRLHAPLKQRRQFTGLVKRVEGEDIYLLVEGSTEEVVLPFSAIEKGNLVGEIHF